MSAFPCYPTAENYFRFCGHPSGTVAFEPTMNRRLVIGLNLAGFQYGQVAKTYDLVPKFGAFTLFGEHRVVFGIEIAVHVLFNQNFSVIFAAASADFKI
jgi:hypothetical protein